MSPKPPIVLPRRPPVRPKPMTIALGALCSTGVIVAADTRIVEENATHDVCKVYATQADSGSYAAAIATNNENAAATLIPKVMDDLRAEDPKKLADVEGIVIKKMEDSGYGLQ
jgi:hypothetical protein